MWQVSVERVVEGVGDKVGVRWMCKVESYRWRGEVCGRRRGKTRVGLAVLLLKGCGPGFGKLGLVVDWIWCWVWVSWIWICF